ncbi:MAG: CHASE4 domain-containing protein [archaeon]
MKLSNRIFVFIAIATTLAFIFSIILSNLLVKNTVTGAETEYAIYSAKMVNITLKEEFDFLQKMVVDWAAWDDTYNFINGNNNNYISTNIAPVTFTNLNLNAIIIAHNNGTVFYEKYYDYETDSELNLSDENKEEINYLIRYISSIKQDQISSNGLLFLNGRYVMFSSYSIFNTDMSVQSDSYLIFARYVGEEQLESIRKHFLDEYTIEQTNALIENIYTNNTKQLSKDVYFNIINENYAESLLQLYDVIGNPIGIVHVKFYRENYIKLKTTFFYFFIMLFFGFFVITASVVFLLERNVVNKIDEFNKTITNIIETNDLSQMVNITADEEIKTLANRFNEMMQKLYKYRQYYLESNKNLEENNLKLKELDRAKDDFLSNVSHEIKTPITSLKTYTQLLLSDSFEKIKKGQREALEVILESIKQLDSIVNELLDLSRYEAGKMKLELQMEEICSSIKEVIKEFAPQIESLNGKIVFKREKFSRLILIDNNKIKEVIRNLINNSIKYKDEHRKLKITIDLKEERDKIFIIIEDNGMGIKNENRVHLFSKFYQVDQSLNKKIRGTGLGLAISKQIIIAHEGNILVESEYGKWTRFTVILPYR